MSYELIIMKFNCWVNATYGFVQFFDTLPNGTCWFIVVCVTESIAPMAKVRWNHKQIFRISKIWRKELAIHLLNFRLQTANQNRNNCELIFEIFHHLCNIWQMHFDRMLINISLHVHPLKLLCCIQIGDNFRVDFEIIERSFVFLANWQGALPQTDVMRWTKNEDSFHGCWRNLTISPSSCFSTIGISRVRLK